MPIDALNESMISMGVVPSSALAATCADCIVADSRADRLMQTIALAPSSLRRRNVSSNAPTDGAAVSGSTGEAASSRQNASMLSSLRSTYSRSPKRMVSGTTSTPSSAQIASGRSHALSVTMRTGMRPPRLCAERRAWPSIPAPCSWLHAHGYTPDGAAPRRRSKPTSAASSSERRTARPTTYTQVPAVAAAAVARNAVAGDERPIAPATGAATAASASTAIPAREIRGHRRHDRDREETVRDHVEREGVDVRGDVPRRVVGEHQYEQLRELVRDDVSR